MSEKHPPIPTSVFDLSALPKHERFTFWRESISCVFDVEVDRHTRQNGDFHSRIWAAMHGELFMAETTAFAQNWSRGSAAISRDGMDHYMIQAFEAGALRIKTRGDEQVNAGDILVFDLAQEAGTTSTAMRNLSLAIPRRLLAPMLHSPDGHHLRKLEGSAPLTAMLREHLRRLKSVSEQITVKESLELTPSTLSLVAASLNAAPDAESLTPKALLSRSAEIRQHIEERLSEPSLTVADIAADLAISRSRLYKFFAPEGGVNAYLRRRRMKRASALLLGAAGRAMPISRIAKDCGFSSESAFSRSFRGAFGVSPREFRNGDAPRRASKPLANLDRRYEGWLNRLSA